MPRAPPEPEAAHRQHGGQGAEPERDHDLQAAQRGAAGCRLRGEGIDQRAGEEAVQHAKCQRRARPGLAQQGAQRLRQPLRARAAQRMAAPANEPGQVQPDHQHEQPGENGQCALHHAGRAAFTRMADQQHAEIAGQRAEEGIAADPAEVIAQVPQPRGKASAGRGAQATGKATAHADAVHAAGGACQEHQPKIAHRLSRYLRTDR
ncbi:hypothetical protein D3C72_991820 [compost metagenome]